MARGLAALPAAVVERASSPEAFGSWYLVFRFGPHLFRLVFDGKDPACILERRTRTALGDEWQPTAWQRMGPAAVVFPVEDLLAAVRRDAASRG